MILVRWKHIHFVCRTICLLIKTEDREVSLDFMLSFLLNSSANTLEETSVILLAMNNRSENNWSVSHWVCVHGIENDGYSAFSFSTIFLKRNFTPIQQMAYSCLKLSVWSLALAILMEQKNRQGIEMGTVFSTHLHLG